MRRITIGLGGAALVIAGAAFLLWSHDRPTPRPAIPAPPQQAALPPPVASAPAPAPPAPSPAPAAPTLPSFDIVKVDPTGHAVIAGRAAPGAKVRVLDGDKPLGEVTADKRGEWVLTPDAPMSPGERQLTLEATDPGGAKTKSSDTVALAVAPAPKTESAGTVAVLLPGSSDQPAQALQAPNAGTGGLSLDTAEYNDRGSLMMSGHAPPGATLRLYAENELLGTITADAQGKWSSVAPRPKAAGKIELRIDQLAADGSVAQRVVEPFEPQAAEAASGMYTVRTGNSLWEIARKTYGGGMRYTVIYAANRAHIRDPNLIYPGQVIALPKS